MIGLGARSPGDGPVLAEVPSKERHVEARRDRSHAAVDVGHRDDPCAPASWSSRAVASPDVAEALDGDARAAEIEADPPGGVLDRVRRSLAGGVGATDRAADRDRLAGDDAGDGVAAMHRDRVHDPGHRLGVGADVRRRDVASPGPMIGSSSVANRRVNASSSRHAHRAGIAGHAALGPAERHVDQGALPGHPHRQGADVVDVGVRVEADPALGRSARHVVLDAVALEHLDPCRRRAGPGSERSARASGPEARPAGRARAPGGRAAASNCSIAAESARAPADRAGGVAVAIACIDVSGWRCWDRRCAASVARPWVR